MSRERENHGAPGLPVLFILLAAMGLLLWWLLAAVRVADVPAAVGTAIGLIVCAVLLGGLFMVNPNEGKVLQLFGRYVGTARAPGLRWANLFYTKKAVSLRVRNFESSRLKVNDLEGNPVDRGRRGVAGRRDGRGGVRGGRLRTTSTSRARRPCAISPPATRMTPTPRTRSRCGATRRRWPSTSSGRSRSA